MLPLASNYSIVRRFIEHCDMWSGQVLHALVAAIEILMKDYYVSVYYNNGLLILNIIIEYSKLLVIYFLFLLYIDVSLSCNEVLL